QHSHRGESELHRAGRFTADTNVGQHDPRWCTVAAERAVALGAAKLSILAPVQLNAVNTAKQKMHQGKPAFGYSLGLGSPLAAACRACRLPPRGIRSWGVGRARVYGDDYFDWIDDQVFVAVQIESIQAVQQAEAIMATPGVDGCWAGPADLALSMGIDPRKAS